MSYLYRVQHRGPHTFHSDEVIRVCDNIASSRLGSRGGGLAVTVKDTHLGSFPFPPQVSERRQPRWEDAAGINKLLGDGDESGQRRLRRTFGKLECWCSK